MTTQGSCTDFEARLARAADGALSGDEMRALDAHLAQCGACRLALDEQRQARAMLQSAPDAAVSPGFHARVMTSIRAESSWPLRWNFRVWTWRLLPVAAALAAAAVLLVVRGSDGTVARTAQSPSAIDLRTIAANSTSVPVSDALWSASISDTSLLSLMLSARGDEALSAHAEVR
jgi:anti-sigma factor RsiW